MSQKFQENVMSITLAIYISWKKTGNHIPLSLYRDETIINLTNGY